MGLAFATTVALCLWVILWSIGIKAIDGMLLSMLIILVAAGIKMLSRFLPGQQTLE
jgi:hypothetical protein